MVVWVYLLMFWAYPHQFPAVLNVYGSLTYCEMSRDRLILAHMMKENNSKCERHIVTQ